MTIIELMDDSHVTTVADTLIQVPYLPVLINLIFERTAAGRRISRGSRLSRCCRTKIYNFNGSLLADIVVAVIFVPLLMIHVIFAFKSASAWIRVSCFASVELF